jgi:hypothetical protein
VPSVQNIDEEKVVTRLTFNDIDSALNDDNEVESINAPKTIERLEEISTSRAIQRKLDEEADEDEDKIQIHTDTIDLMGLDVLDLDNLDGPKMDDISLDFETL